MAEKRYDIDALAAEAVAVRQVNVVSPDGTLTIVEGQYVTANEVGELTALSVVEGDDAGASAVNVRRIINKVQEGHVFAFTAAKKVGWRAGRCALWPAVVEYIRERQDRERAVTARKAAKSWDLTAALGDDPEAAAREMSRLTQEQKDLVRALVANL